MRPVSSATKVASVLFTLAFAALVVAGCGSDDGKSDGGGKLEAANVTSLAEPTDIVPDPSDPKVMYVTERSGQVRVMVDGIPQPEPLIDLTGRTGEEGEMGLLGAAFPPDYDKSGLFYVYFTDLQQNINLLEFHRKSEFVADPDSERQVLKIEHPKTKSHFGGTIGFLGNDLYLATGDGGGDYDEHHNAQNMNTLLGKLLRIDPRQKGGRPYTVPKDNPLVGKPGRDEIFAWGFRNPFRWTFDTRTEDTGIVIADVGQSDYEEIDSLPLSEAKGANFGWPGLEGNMRGRGPKPEDSVRPTLVLHHPPYCSVIGGVVVSEDGPADLAGKYVFTDFCKNEIQTLDLDQKNPQPQPTGLDLPQISSFGQGGDGSLYATSLGGTVYRFEQ
ncbi:MAG: PQQ-dependent sugar dehydrogenase [Solirubrobacterales bacterium]|nr:PQQ-dependent sugar dehydrogenase [Solirubrobacterales bacterium]